jgi:hypothetical protein
MASENACGFCGRADNPLCQQLMLKEPAGRGTTKILSSCPYFYAARYGSASKYSTARPSTNVPVVCQLCFPSSSRVRRQPPARFPMSTTSTTKLTSPLIVTPTNKKGAGGSAIPMLLGNSAIVHIQTATPRANHTSASSVVPGAITARSDITCKGELADVIAVTVFVCAGILFDVVYQLVRCPTSFPGLA